MRLAALQTLLRAAPAMALAAALAVCLGLSGCGGSSGGTAADAASDAASTVADAASDALDAAANAVTGTGAESGTTSGSTFKATCAKTTFDATKATGASGALIDTSQAAQGYVGASATSSARLKFQVACGDDTYNYDLAADGTAQFFPLNMGDGTYTLSVLQNTNGNRYATVYTTKVQVKLASETAPYLHANVYCSFTKKSVCARKAAELTAGAANAGDALQAIYNYVVTNVTYDDAKAADLAGGTGYVPDPDSTLASGTGICFDYASLCAAMLRSVGIPCKIVTGYVGGQDIYHAWNMVYIDGTWQAVHVNVAQNTWTVIDPTLASAGASSTVGDGSSYEDHHVY